MDTKGFDQFKVLLRRFVDGLRWINERVTKGINVDKDKEDFKRFVIDPMEELWSTFTDEEKDYWLHVVKVIRLFNGRIV